MALCVYISIEKEGLVHLGNWTNVAVYSIL
jgi:hypothetical protein